MRQPLYFDGMSEALDRLERMDETELLGVLDTPLGVTGGSHDRRP